MGVANEILQIDAGWCKTETLVKTRKIKVIRRILDKPSHSTIKRILMKATNCNTEWTREAEAILKSKINEVAHQPW